MRFPLWVGALALTLIAIVPRPASAHVVEDVVQLGFNGWLAPFGDAGDERYTDVWAEGSLAYLGTVGSGVAVLDLDTGAYASGVLRNPEYVTAYAPAGHLDYQDVKVYDGVGYFSGGQGTDVVDLSVPTAPTLLSRIGPANQGFSDAKNAAVGSGYLYQVSPTSPEIRVFNLADPTSPTLVRSLATGDPVGLRDVTLVDDRLYVAGSGGAYIYDVGQVATAAPTLGASFSTGGTTGSVWPTGDAETLLVTHHQAGGELSAWDLSPTPTLIDSQSAGDFGFNSYGASEVVVVGSRAYVAWNQGGIQVVDIDQLQGTGMQRAGSWIITGFDDFLGFDGVRSVYPFLGQEQVLVSDSKRGLWRFDTTAVPVDILGDYNSDGRVSQLDYDVWRSHYGSAQSIGDGNDDGVVDAADYTLWRKAYEAASAPADAVPEPSGLMMTLLLVAPWRGTRRLPLHPRNPQR